MKGVTRPWQRCYVVGDVHGERDRLADALAELTDRPVVLVGDYIDRGPDSHGALEVLVAATRQRDDVVPLLGNHEIRLLTFLRDGVAAEFGGGGALATLHSYLPSAARHVTADAVPLSVWKAFRGGFPPEHRALLAAMPLWLETPDLFVSHAGQNPDAPGARTAIALTLGGPERFARATAAAFDKPVACGHFIQRSGMPHVGDRFMCVDIGCGTFPGRPLAVLTWPERTVLTF